MVPPSRIVCFTELVVVRVGLAKCIEYICLLGFDNWQPRALFNQMVLTSQRIQTEDTTILDGSGLGSLAHL